MADNWGYRIVETRIDKKHAEYSKYNILGGIKAKLLHKKGNKKINVHENFCISVPNSSIEALIMDNTNNNTLWEYSITKWMSALEILKMYYIITHQIKSLQTMMVGNGHQCGLVLVSRNNI